MSTRNQWFVKNLTARQITISDLNKLPTVGPNKSLDSLVFHTKEEVAQSKNLKSLVNQGWVRVVKVEDGTHTNVTADNIDELSVGGGGGGAGLTNPLTDDLDADSHDITNVDTIHVNTINSTGLVSPPAITLGAPLACGENSISLNGGDATGANLYLNTGAIYGGSKTDSYWGTGNGDTLISFNNVDTETASNDIAIGVTNEDETDQAYLDISTRLSGSHKWAYLTLFRQTDSDDDTMATATAIVDGQGSRLVLGDGNNTTLPCYISFYGGAKASGWGIRANDGVVEVKNSGGDWATIDSGGSPPLVVSLMNGIQKLTSSETPQDVFASTTAATNGSPVFSGSSPTAPFAIPFADLVGKILRIWLTYKTSGSDIDFGEFNLKFGGYSIWGDSDWGVEERNIELRIDLMCHDLDGTPVFYRSTNGIQQTGSTVYAIANIESSYLNNGNPLDEEAGFAMTLATEGAADPGTPARVTVSVFTVEIIG